MVSELIPFGRYNVELSARNGDNSGRAMFSMEIPAFGDRRPEISTVEIAYEVEPDTSGIFYKNGLRVMPNPSHTFSRIEGPGYFYAEGYGLNVGRSADSVFYVAVEILNSDGDVIKRQPTLSYQKPGESAVIAGAFNIDSLEAGKYGLRVSLVDGDLSAYTLNNFTVVVPRDVARRDILQGILNEFPEATEITTEEDARKFREEVSYIATHSELELFDSLPLEGKSAFLSDFWARRDPDPATSENEFKIEYFKRFKYVTANFSQFKGARPGWRSDRGRVFLVYGEPTEIERFPPSLEGRAWERWWYHGMEGGVYFVFVDMEAAGDYTLVHSSKQDEIKDYNWENKIKFSWEQR
jgi:GWxTD domain-containing protein